MLSGEGGPSGAPVLASEYTSLEDSDRQVSQDFSTVQWRAFSFTPTAGTATGVGLKLLKDVNVTGDLIIRIETDNAGDPSGTLVHANATQNVTVDGFGTSPPASFRTHNFATPFAMSAVLQWVVFKPAFTSSASEIVYVRGRNLPLAGFTFKRTLDSGSNWADQTQSFNYEIYGA